MSVSSDFISFKTTYQLSPIILTDGLATAQGGSIPISNLLGNNDLSPSLDGAFANFMPVPGSTLLSQQICMYPLANQSIAANAVIAQPLNVSMLMICPAGNYAGVQFKQSAITSLQATLAKHNNLGGTYSVATPAFIYTGCIMTSMRDVSGGESKQVQYVYQLDFVQPLTSLAAAQQAYNNLTKTIANSTPPSGGTSAASGLSVGNPTQLSVEGPAPPTQLGGTQQGATQ